MKTILLKENLRDGLIIVERAVSKSLSLPILGNILLSTKKNFFELSATDLEIGVRYQILSKNEEEGQVVVPARILSQLSGLLPQPSVELKTTNEHLAVQSGDYSAIVKTLSAEDFPLIPTNEKDSMGIEVNASLLSQGLQQVAGFTGQSQTHSEITGVYFCFEGGVLKVAATDSFRLGEKTLSPIKTVSAKTSFILPAKTARELIAIFSEREGMLRVHASSTQAIFDYEIGDDPTQPRIQVVSRLLEGEYPHYQEIVPKEYKTKAVFDKAAFINQVRAASIFTGRTSEVRLNFRPSSREVEVFSQNTDIGEHASKMHPEIEGEELSVAFNWKFLLDGLTVMKSREFEMRLSGEDSPAVLVPVEPEGYFYVVMPIKAI